MLNQVILVGRIINVNQTAKFVTLRCDTIDINAYYPSDFMNTWLNDQAIGTLIAIRGKLAGDNKVLIEKISLMSHE